MTTTVRIAAASAVTTAHTPPTAESEVAPQRSCDRYDRSRRGTDDDEEREDGERDRRRGGAVNAVLELGRIEFARGGGALAEHLVIGDFLDRCRCPVAELLAGAFGGRFGAAEPPQAEPEHDGGGDDAEPRRCKRRGAEERHRDGVLDRRRPWFPATPAGGCG